MVPSINPIWFETVSHKLLRLAAPWLLLGLACASAVEAILPAESHNTLIQALVLAQLAFYSTAALGRRAKQLGGAARTFVVLNAAALVGLWGFLTGRQRVTWQITR